MTARPDRIPFRPSDYREAAGTVAKAYWRGIAAQVLAEIYKESPGRVLKHLWPSDTAADALLMRSATSPADTTTSAWASQVVGSPLLGPFLSGIQPRSAAARLFGQCLRVDLVGRNAAKLPLMTTVPAPAFIAERAPAPVIAGAFSSVDLGPAKKLMLITGITSELARYSADNAEAAIRTRIGEAAGRTLDTYVFDSTAGDAVRPAGLLYGVSPTTATTGGGLAACVGDLQNITDKICAAGGGSNVWIFAAPKQAVAIPALVHTLPDWLSIVPAPTLAAGTIVGVELDGIGTGFSGGPQIETSTEAILHWESTTPLQIVSGAGPTVATPIMSAFQQDQVVIKFRINCAWCVRAPGLVQVVSGTTW
jgi:hypothetical protein